MGADAREAAAAARPAFRAFAERRELAYYQDWSVPEATQLLRQGFLHEVPNLGLGDLGTGLGKGWLAHVLVSETTATGIESHPFTLVLAQVPATISYAVRILCHDRGLDAEVAENPEADAEVVELDDRGVEVESEAFLRRYRLSTDHDQDQLRVWQLFSPALIHWLTADAPPGFSFELQEGALTCFRPGYIAEASELDQLLAAAARIHGRVAELARSAAGSAPAHTTRAAIVDAELAGVSFAKRPRSVWAATRALGMRAALSRGGWRLGAEAFFREYARSIGFRRIDEAVYRAMHLATPIPCEITQVAAGRLEDLGLDAWLLLGQDEERGAFGWTVLVALLRVERHRHDAAALEAAAADGVESAYDGRSLIVWKPDSHAWRRTAKGLDEFMTTASRLIAASVKR